MELYKNFTGHEVSIEAAKICVSCKESLRLSLEFLNLCKSSHDKFDQSVIKISEIPFEIPDIIFATEDENTLDVHFDQEDEIPIASIKQQISEEKEVIKFN
jgi:hypothetical protein